MRRPRRLLVPEHAHPVVVRLFKEMNHQQCGLEDMEKRSGVSSATIRNWRTHRAPTISNLDACWNVLGFKLVAHPIDGRPMGRPRKEQA